MQKHDPQRTQSGLPLLTSLIIGLLFFGAYLTVERLGDDQLPSMGVALGFLLTYLLLATLSFVLFRAKAKKQRSEQVMLETLNTKMHNLFKYMVDLPYAIADEHGRIRAVNSALQELLGSRDPFYRGNVADICGGVTLQAIIEAGEKTRDHSRDVATMTDAAKKAEVESLEESPEESAERAVALRERGAVVHMKNGRRYLARAYEVTLNEKPNYLVTLSDITDYLDLKEKSERDMPAVAYIDVDNLEELTQHTRVNYRDASRQVDDVLIRFAAHMGGLLREYERDRYLLLFSQDKLRQCEEDKFTELLDGIRNIRLGEYSIPVTVSVGISLADATMEERAKDAGTALDMALQRGGDQVAVRRHDGIHYYGGQTRPFQRRTKVTSRVIANYLLTKISEADNLLIMGHKNPDFDSIGSCLGLAQLGLFAGVPTNVIMDLNNASFKAATERLTANPIYRDMFITGHKGLDKIKPGTLLIISDANNFKIIEAPDVAENVKQVSGKIAIVDHHRQTGEYDFDPVINYIDPSASSASELVTEMLEHSDTGSEAETSTLVSNEVASVILSGIVLDTNNFSRNTGSRTLDAARYLFGKGANAEYVHSFFNEEYADYVCERSFSGCMLIHDNTVGLTWSEGTGRGSDDRVAAAKEADKLLNVKGVHASFALVKVGDAVHISGRSDGTINVQLILERLGGGGRFDTAGAAMQNVSSEQARADLIAAIDAQLAEGEGNT
jgi:c-di-AMP phosphodiesterase-like protein